MNKNLILKYSWLLVPLLALPYFTTVGVVFGSLDELRYLAIAWHMYTSHYYLIPMVNGNFFPDKGPLFFWVVALGWHIFGVGLFWPQLLIALLLVLTVFLTQKMYNLIFPDDLTGAELLPFIYVAAPSAFILIMFRVDLIIVFVSLAYNYFALSYLLKNNNKSKLQFIAFAASCIAIGLLTKGPIIYLFTLLPSLFTGCFYRTRRNLLVPCVFGCLIGTLLVILFWLIPVIRDSNHAYISQILFHEIADRYTGSTFHNVHWGVYLFNYLPFLIVPWILNFIWIKKVIMVIKEFLYKSPMLIWICVLNLIIFSLWKQKEPYYILPIAPYLILVVSRFISVTISNVSILKLNRILSRACLLILALFLLVFSFSAKSRSFLFPEFSIYHHLVYFQIMVCFAVISIGFFIFYTNKESKNEIKVFALIFAFVINFFLGFISYAEVLQTNYVSVIKIIHRTEQNGDPIITYNSTYNGELGYLARLRNVISTVSNPVELNQWLRLNPHGLVITNGVCPSGTIQNTIFDVPSIKLFLVKNNLFLLCSPLISATADNSKAATVPDVLG